MAYGLDHIKGMIDREGTLTEDTWEAYVRRVELNSKIEYSEMESYAKSFLKRYEC